MPATRTRTAWPGSRTLVSVAVIVVALCVIGVIQTAPGQRLGRSLGLIPTPSAVVSLSFADPSRIAALMQVVPAPKRVSVAFVVADSADHSRTFAWTISAPLASAQGGVVRTARGTTGYVQRDVVTDCASPGPARRRVEIRLRRPQRQIGFWVTCHG